MSAKKLLELLDKNALLEDSVMAELRKQVVEGKGKVTAETIAKALVDKGHLTKFQATKLVGEATAEQETKSAAKTSSAAEDDLLGLAPLDESDSPSQATDAKAGNAKSGKGAKPKQPVEEVVMLEEADALTPVEDAGHGLTPVGPSAPTDTVMLQPLSDGLTALDEPDPFGAPAPLASAPGLQRGGGGPLIKPKKREIRWDTKLMLGGFGFLIFLLFAGGVLYFSVFSQPILEIWKAAEEAYNAGNFNDAKDKYEKYLAAAGEDDENSSKARVRIHLTRLRADVDDPERGLTTATDLLPKIDSEADSSIARDEYPGILPQIAEGFIKRAQKADTKKAEELVAKAKEARELLHKPGVITAANRPKIQPQLTRIDEDIALLERDIQQDKDLAKTIVDIGAAVDAADTQKGYQIYVDLLKKYPGLKNDVGLMEAVAKITARERTLVKVKPELLTPVTTDDTRKSEYRVVLANRTPGDAKIENQVATLLYGNSIYALDAGTGRLLWSRYLGTTARANPVRVSNQPDADVLLVDAQHQELLRVKAADGKLVWRLGIGEPFTEPAVAGLNTYVSTDSGRILSIVLETGESKQHTSVQQRLTVSPVVAPDRPRMYQVGEHSNLYVIHSETMQCEDVIYLGHKGGSIEIAPLILMGHVFVTESPASNYSLVHAFRIRSQGEGPKLFRPQDPVRTAGRVAVPLVPYGRRLLVLTDRAEIRVFDIDSTKSENTLTDAGKLPPTQPQPHVGYPLADGSTIWLADDKLAKYTAQVTRKEITRDQAITNVGDSFVAPLQLFGNYLVHARRAAGSTGVTVACIHVDDPRKTIWQTQLGVPAGRIAVDSAKREIVAISSAATLFQINFTTLKAGYADQPVMSAAAGNTGLSFTDPIEFENGVLAFFNPADNKQLLVFNPAVSEARLRIVPLLTQDSQATCPPIAFLGGLLMPSDKGDVWLFKISDGSQQVLPFQPKLEPGTKVVWREPTTVGDGGREIVLVDDRRNIFRVGLKEQPQPHLAELLANKLDVDISSGLAAVGETIYGAVRTPEKGDTLVAVNAKDLKLAKEFDLKGGRVTWGPTRVGDVVMIVTDGKELRIFDAAQKERWQKPAVMHGNPAGPPLISDANYIFASVQGEVWGVVAATGQEEGSTKLGEPLGAGPVAYQDRLLLCGNDGTLHVIQKPSMNSTSVTGAGGQ